MSILVSNENGWFICVKSFFQKCYKNCLDENFEYRSLKFRDDFFEIKTPFVMNSSAVKLGEEIDPSSKKVQTQKLKRKKKPPKESSHIFNSDIDNLIKEKSMSLLQEALSLGHLDNSDITSEEWFHNNLNAKKAAKELISGSFEDAIPTSFCNPNDFPIIKQFGVEEYLLPAQSSFYSCDISDACYLTGTKYDLIVLDPPWENKSVKRNKKYDTLSCESLLKLPIEDLAGNGCLVVVWVTNKKKQIDFVKNVLFPKWKIDSDVVWHWLKITQKGHFTHPIDSHHKKPYENLLLGRLHFDPSSSNFSSHARLEPHKIILNVPSSIHSHKPPLVEILEPYLPENPKCLELFARYLLPKWSSLGNEVIKLQNVKLFEKS